MRSETEVAWHEPGDEARETLAWALGELATCLLAQWTDSRGDRPDAPTRLAGGSLGSGTLLERDLGVDGWVELHRETGQRSLWLRARHADFEAELELTGSWAPGPAPRVERIRLCRFAGRPRLAARWALGLVACLRDQPPASSHARAEPHRGSLH